MKKIALFTLALVATLASRAQIFQPATLYGKYEKGLAVQRILMMPTGCGNPSTPAAADLVPKMAATYFDSCANRYWIFNPKTVSWDSLHVGAVVTAGGPVDWNTQGNNLTSLAYDPKLGATSAHDLVLITNNQERARFKASGNFWVSDTLGVNNIMAKPSTDPDYEIVVIPDIQNMVRYNFAYGRPIFDWLRDSAAYYNVKAVLQVGDLTDWNTAAEWDTVAAWFNKIPSSIPVQVAPGNHDYGTGFNPAGRDATRYKAWASSFNSGKSYYVGNYAGSDENYFTKWTVGSKKYMAVGLEFLPRQVVLDWAGHIIDSVYAVEPDREVMIVTHAYIDVYGELATDTSTYSGISYGMSADNSGQEMWDKLIKKKPSIKWVFNGHFLIPGAWAQVGLADRIVATGENGNLINQMFVNYQDDVNWGDGYFLRMKFQPSKGTVAARYYSAYYSADDSRKPGFVLQNPALSVTTSVAVKGTQSVGEDLRVAGELKVETLTKKTVPYIGEDHVLKSDGSFYFDEAARVPNARGLRINFPRTWASDHIYQNAYIDARDSAGNTIFQIKGNKYDPIPFGETYLANLYIGDSAGYYNPYGWNNIGIGPKALYRAKWGSNSVSETVVMGKRAGYGLGKRNSSYNNVIIGVEAVAGDSTFCRFCTILGQAGGAGFPGGEDMTGVGQAVFVNAKVNSFGSSAIGSNTLQNAYSYQAMAVGQGAFGNGDTVLNSIAIGARAGRDGKHKGSILIGTFAKYLGDTENEFYLDNDGTDGTPELLWGRFINNPMMRIQGDLQVDDTLTNVTYATNDSSNRVASTAWVKQQGFAAGGSSPWTTSGSNIYNSNTGKVSIGATTGSGKLNVNGVGNNVVATFFHNDNTGGAYIGTSGNNESDEIGLNDISDLTIASYSPSSSVFRYANGVIVGSGSNIGVGNFTPAKKLDVTGTGRFTDTLYAPTMGAGNNSTAVATTAFVTTAISSKLADPGANGMLSRTGSGVTTARTITGSAGIAVSNGDGVAGNPALSVNINGLTGDTATLDDELVFSDINNSNTIKKISLQQLLQTYSKLYRLKVGYEYFGEFIGGTIGTTIAPNDVAAQNSGTGAASTLAASGIANRPGVIRSTTGTTATGRSGVSSSLAAFFLGGGTWVYETAVNIATLSNGTERYQLMIGFLDNFSSANQTDGVYFLYDDGGVTTGSAASANWQIVTSRNSTRTFTTTSTAVPATTWVTLRIEVNAAGNRADYFINGTNVGNITSNIPAASGRELGYGWGIIKSVGTTARTADIDYLMVQNIFTSQR